MVAGASGTSKLKQVGKRRRHYHLFAGRARILGEHPGTHESVGGFLEFLRHVIPGVFEGKDPVVEVLQGFKNVFVAFLGSAMLKKLLQATQAEGMPAVESDNPIDTVS